jgi:hypothetical protein
MKEDFLNDLIDLPVSFLASKWILERTPFAFNEDSELYLNWKEKLSKKILVDSSAIVFTGSSGCGFSLHPYKAYKKFNNESDIDIALVSDHHFDIAWHSLRNLGSKYYSLTPKQKTSVDDHVNRLIYYGTIATDKILPILPFGKEWTIALNAMTKEEPIDSRVINIRIYKDFKSLRDYQTNNLEKLRQTLLEK